MNDLRDSLQEQRADAAEREPGYRIPLEPLDLMLQEAAKLSYNLAEPDIQKISMSKPLLIMVLFELMQKSGVYNEIAPDPALAIEWLRLYYFLSRDLTYHFTMQEYHAGFIDQFRTGAEESPFKGTPRRHVNTSGMNEVAVFTALFNAAKPQGMGFVHDEPRDITENEGAELMQQYLDSGFDGEPRYQFDYVEGRRMKISVSDLHEGYIDVTNYDEGNGEGTAQRAIERLPRIF
ncbi:hypothetical protein [Hymenobacter terrigena]